MCTYPLDVIRTRLAVQVTSVYYTSIAHATRTIIANEGYGGLLKGMRPTLLGIAPYAGVNFATFEWLKRTIGTYQNKDPKQLSTTTQLIAGSLAGAAGQTGAALCACACACAC